MDAHVPTRLFDDPVDDRQSQAGPRAHLFGREEGLEDMGPNVVRHATAGVGYRQLNEPSRLQVRVVGEVLVTELDRAGLDGQRPAPRAWRPRR